MSGPSALSRRIIVCLLSLPCLAVAAPPNVPGSVSPRGWANRTPELTGSSYSDPEGDPHTETQFQVRPSGGTYGGAGSFDSGPLGDGEDQWDTPTLVAGQTYFWRVRYGDGAWSGWSAEASFTVDGSPPSIPGAVAVSPNPSATTGFTWGASIDTGGSGSITYDLSLSFDRGTYVLLAGALSTPSATLSLGPGNYLVRARAQDGVLNASAYSAPTEFSVVADAGVAVPNPISVPAMSQEDVPVSWPDTGADEYVLARSSNDGGTWSIVRIGPSASWMDLGLNTGTYRYRVAGVHGGLAGNWSPASSGVVVDDDEPSRPPSISAFFDGSRVTVSWGAAGDTGGSGLAEYDVARAPASPAWTTLGTVDGGTTSYLDFPPEGSWQYRVRSRDGVGNESSWRTMVTPIAVDLYSPSAPGGGGDSGPVDALPADPSAGAGGSNSGPVSYRVGCSATGGTQAVLPVALLLLAFPRRNECWLPRAK